MIAAGGVIAVFVMIAAGIARAESRRVPAAVAAAPDRNGLAASLLFQVLTAGGMPADDALREIRRGAGLAAAVTRDIDVPSWAERFAQVSSSSQRHDLLETAVRLAVRQRKLVPLIQYAALLDLSFSLGFQTNTLAGLRDQYGFDYVDHAKNARPREADRAGRTTFFARQNDDDRAALLSLLGLEGSPSRQSIISAYRRLVLQHHPDHFHGASSEAKSDAAARFIEITRAYETLMAVYRD